MKKAPCIKVTISGVHGSPTVTKYVSLYINRSKTLAGVAITVSVDTLTLQSTQNPNTARHTIHINNIKMRLHASPNTANIIRHHSVFPYPLIDRATYLDSDLYVVNMNIFENWRELNSLFFPRDLGYITRFIILY